PPSKLLAARYASSRVHRHLHSFPTRRSSDLIIEAAKALYCGHSVADISRSDAGGAELHNTTQRIGELIADARANAYKAACFITGDRKSTRLNSSHVKISYAVFCVKTKRLQSH